MDCCSCIVIVVCIAYSIVTWYSFVMVLILSKQQTNIIHALNDFGKRHNITDLQLLKANVVIYSSYNFTNLRLREPQNI